ncbi:MAG: deoxyguanosinetriphosphate triphosphohydrolase [Myxococcota bacterium]
MNELRDRARYEREEDERLSPLAIRSARSRGRVVAEPEHPHRTTFQRDRDRVVHSRAFRRLEYKTQVFVYHEGDHYRNRLTHTLEGSQIARTLARILRLNEDLAEAVVLAHDLGHTPFGHAGEHTLDRLMRDDGGFDHNRQSLRIVDLLEERYPRFRGLNLSWETREGILKHGCHWPHPVPVPEATPQLCLEAQVADAADEIAYLNHDLDDGLRSGLLTLEQLEGVGLWARMRRDVTARMPGSPERVLRAQTIVGLINELVTDLAEETTRRGSRFGLASPEDVRAAPEPTVSLGAEREAARAELKDFLSKNLYHHPRVAQVTQRAERTLTGLFGIYRADPGRLPARVVARLEEDGEARAVADYLAGMTDRFALAEHGRLLG